LSRDKECSVALRSRERHKGNFLDDSFVDTVHTTRCFPKGHSPSERQDTKYSWVIILVTVRNDTKIRDTLSPHFRSVGMEHANQKQEPREIPRALPHVLAKSWSNGAMIKIGQQAMKNEFRNSSCSYHAKSSVKSSALQRGRRRCQLGESRSTFHALGSKAFVKLQDGKRGTRDRHSVTTWLHVSRSRSNWYHERSLSQFLIRPPNHQRD